MHGDFTPWNLRQVQGGSLALIDWEDAGWAPQGADEVFYRATWAALGHRLAAHGDRLEAVQFWLGRMAGHPTNARDHRLALALGEVLGRMAGSSGGLRDSGR